MYMCIMHGMIAAICTSCMEWRQVHVSHARQCTLCLQRWGLFINNYPQEPEDDSVDLQLRTSEQRSDIEGSPKVARCSPAQSEDPVQLSRVMPIQVQMWAESMSSETETNINQIGAWSLPLSRQSREGAQSQNPPLRFL